MAARVAGLILAGGAGERYGGPKAFATLPDGRTFLAACAQLLAAGGAAPLLATLPPGTSTPAVGDLEALVLPAPGLPMFDSLRLGLAQLLAHSAWNAVVVLPVDHPLVAPETVTALARCEDDAVLPSHQGKHGHPVMLSRRVADRIASGAFVGPTLREVLRAVGARVLVVEDPGITANCNTPAALAAAFARLRR
jgi:CTP:molybdopterin cytidylyltransferase MocA